jgi:hypothetical protein
MRRNRGRARFLWMYPSSQTINVPVPIFASAGMALDDVSFASSKPPSGSGPGSGSVGAWPSNAPEGMSDLPSLLPADALEVILGYLT